MISKDILCGMLFDGTDSLNNYLQLYGILVNFVDMPTTVQGLIYFSLKGEYHIVINDNLSPVIKIKIFMHELKHIIKDFPQLGSIIGLDFQNNTIEVEADIFAKNILKTLKSKTDERRKATIGR